MRFRPVFAVLVSLFTAALAGCDLPTGSLGWSEGRATFRYAGADEGRFRAEGALPEGYRTPLADPERQYPTHAAGGLFNGELWVSAQFHHWWLADKELFLHGRVPGPGTYTVGPGQAVEGVVRIGSEFRDQADGYVLTSGTVTLESAGGGRLRGRFKGAATGPGGVVLKLEDGAFDVPDVAVRFR